MFRTSHTILTSSFIFILACFISGCVGGEGYSFSMWDGSPSQSMIAYGNDKKAKLISEFTALAEEAKTESLDEASKAAYQEAYGAFYDLRSALAISVDQREYAALATKATSAANRFKLRGAGVVKHANVLESLAQTVKDHHEIFYKYDQSADGTHNKQLYAFEFNLLTQVLKANLEKGIETIN